MWEIRFEFCSSLASHGADNATQNVKPTSEKREGEEDSTPRVIGFGTRGKRWRTKGAYDGAHFTRYFQLATTLTAAGSMTTLTAAGSMTK